MKSSGEARRKVCVVVNSRANYGRIKSVLEAIKAHPQLELQLITGASALLHRFGQVVDRSARDGFEPCATVYSIVEGETPTTMAKSTGMAIIELATQFENLRPDVVLTVADRFETIATAIAASYMNIPVAHTQGGEVTGSIDESVRHAVTKLSHIHFPATELARDYLIRMGEDPATVHWTGCPSIDAIASIDLSLPRDIFERYRGVGADLDPTQPYVVVLQHPVTTEYGQGLEQIEETLEAVSPHRHADRVAVAECRCRLGPCLQGHPAFPRKPQSGEDAFLHQLRGRGLCAASQQCRLPDRQLELSLARGRLSRRAGGQYRHASERPGARTKCRACGLQQ